ncbi:MAG: DUF2892 domain-containing protein [Chitinivibrionales bacterium]|nr:DUF2892 domain-containing protein [Chitinivibrionales bacterium]
MKNRVAEHTPPSINARIRRRIDVSVTYYAKHPDRIDTRLRELDNEWDIERLLEANAASLMLYGLLFGLVGRRYYLLLLPLVVAGFLLQHAIQGWCPPIVVFRRLGVRTKDEILLERYALRAIHGDLDPIFNNREREPSEKVGDVLNALEK